MAEENDSKEVDLEVTEPIIIDLGKQKSKRIKRLMEGRGKLWFEVEDVIEEVGSMLGDDLEGKTLVPLVLVYRKRPKLKRQRGMFGF
ncbi:MAG: hypothetical protein ISR58_02475 [Anaerolineales bacterium]|nr:hypothetical protein [Chloroflexota bacterium]MBL6980034.1 hypothetical protein [Anaerolineales bacterium]